MKEKREHLGIPLFKREFELKAQVGYRYWRIDEDGKLLAPIVSNQAWGAGLNKSDCVQCKGKNKSSMCACGLYSWRHLHGELFCNGQYFNPLTVVVHGGNQSNFRQNTNDYCIVGSVLMFGEDKKPNTQMLVTKFGAIAAFALPPKPDKELLKRVEKAKEFYGVEVVKPKELFKAAEAYLDEGRLSNYYVPGKPQTIYGDTFATELPWLALAGNINLGKDFKWRRKVGVPAYECDLAVGGCTSFVAPPGFREQKLWQARNAKILGVAAEADKTHGKKKEVSAWRGYMDSLLKEEEKVRVGKGGLFFSKKHGDIVFCTLKATKDADLEQITSRLYNQIGGVYTQNKHGWVKNEQGFALTVWPPGLDDIGFVKLKKLEAKKPKHKLAKAF